MQSILDFSEHGMAMVAGRPDQLMLRDMQRKNKSIIFTT